jgi:hypothetical protein
MPLFGNFKPEDWAVVALRFELCLLVHAFKHDCSDPERTGLHLDHLAFCYETYFRESLSPKSFGVDTVSDLAGLVRDTVYLTKQQAIETLVPDELESLGIFAKLTEEQRRYRHLVGSCPCECHSREPGGWNGRNFPR